LLHRAGTCPTEKERDGKMFHPDLDYGLGKERVAWMRKEVEHNRLESSLAKATRSSSSEEPVPRRGIVARGATILTALFK
jgi:hypothetical protein